MWKNHSYMALTESSRRIFIYTSRVLEIASHAGYVVQAATENNESRRGICQDALGYSGYNVTSCCSSSLLTALLVHSTDQRTNTCNKFPPGRCFVPMLPLLSKFRSAVGLRLGLIGLAYQLDRG